MPDAGGDGVDFVVAQVQKGEAPQLAEGGRQFGQGIVSQVEAAQPLKCCHFRGQGAQAVVAQGEPLQAPQRADFGRNGLQVVGVHVKEGEVLQAADVSGEQLQAVPQAALPFWAHLQDLQLVQAEDLLRNRCQVSAGDLQFLLPFVLWVMLCKVPPEWVRTRRGTSEEGISVHSSTRKKCSWPN